MAVVGVLTPADDTDPPFKNAFNRLKKGLRDAGYGPGKKPVSFDSHPANGDIDKLRTYAKNLAQAATPPNVIVADGTTAVRFLEDYNTSNIPIVQAAGSDPVAAGLTARGNVTGYHIRSDTMSGERLATLKALFPTTARVALLLDGTSVVTLSVLTATAKVAKDNGMQIGVVVVSNPDELDDLDVSDLDGCDGFMVAPGAMFYNHRQPILKLAKDAGVKGVYPEREYADDGGLLVVGHNIPDTFELAGAYVGQILDGAKPVDLPIKEAPSTDRIINSRAAADLKLKLSDGVLARMRGLQVIKRPKKTSS